MMSRDPTGVDPDGVDDSIRLEPAGSRADESVEAPQPTQPAAPHELKIETLTTLDVAALVGAPPPPPTTPAPKKSRRSRGTVTPKAVTPKAANVAFSSEYPNFFIHDDETATYNPRVVNIAATESPKDENGETTLHIRNIATSPVAAKVDANPPAPPIPPSEPRDVQKTLTMADERRKVALAIYESKDLVLDQEETLMPQELLRPTMTALENKPQLISNERPSPSFSKIPDSPMSRTPASPSFSKMLASPISRASPSSAATRPHSNKTQIPAEPRGRSPGGMLQNIHESPSLEAPSQSGSFEDEKKPERRRRGFSIDRKNKPEKYTKSEKAKEEKQKRDKKRGFFKKLFKGKKKESDSSSLDRSIRSTASRDSPVATVAVAREPVSQENVAQEPIAQESSKEPEFFAEFLPESTQPIYAVPQSTPTRVQPVLKPVLKSAEERQYQGDPVVEDVEQSPSILVPQPSVATDEATHPGIGSTASVAASPQNTNVDVSIPQGVSKALSLPSQSEMTHGYLTMPKTFSQDPPDDEHGDPPIFAGKPLISPANLHQLHVTTSQEEEEEQSRIESVRSRIAELYEEHMHTDHPDEDELGPHTDVASSLSNDRTDDYFFNHDEMSALSGPSFEALHGRSKSFGPSADDTVLSEPNGEYKNAKVSTKAQDGGPVPALGSTNIDPYTAPFQDAVMGPLPTPTHLGHLHVQVQHAPSVDPAGASPLQLTTRGRPVAESGFRDPVGESPMAWRKVEVPMNDPVGESPYHAAGPKTSAFDEEISGDANENQLPPNVAPTPIPSDGGKPDTSNALKVIPAEPNTDRATSKATRAALKLAKASGTDAIKEHLASIPTPTNQDLSNDIVGSTPVLSPASDQPAKVNMESKSLAATMEKAAPPRQKKADEAKHLQVETELEKAGFRSTSNTPISTKKPLSVTAAAFTNAKAVAYLHRLHGEPSPRHSWHVSKNKQPEPSPVAKAKPLSAKKTEQGSAPSSSRKKAPSPDEYGAHNFVESQSAVEVDELDTTAEAPTPKRSHSAHAQPPSPEELSKRKFQKTKEGTMFSAYKSKFQGRKPSKKNAPKPETPSKKRAPGFSPTDGDIDSTQQAMVVSTNQAPLVIRPGKMTGLAVARGFELRRIKRNNNIASGKSERVILTPRQQPTGRNRFKFFPAKESEIKDPIQRAGRRLLSKAAIPIQTTARRYIARRAAIDRMWALIEIQSYIRRWRCETNLQAHIHSIVLIQAAFRGWLGREKAKEMQDSATQIQKVVRGYLAAAHVYDTMYYVVRLQAFMKGCYERKMQVKREEAARAIQRYFRGYYARRVSSGSRSAVPIQSLYRGYKARQEYAVACASASMIQSAWRSYSARISFQFQIVDTIIVQSIARRWAACRHVQDLKNLQLFSPASKVQTMWRGYTARSLYEKHLSARRIQVVWRGFQCYTDYIFALVDILVVQRTVRQWLALRKVNDLRQENVRKAKALELQKAAIVLQSNWRRHSAQVTLLYSMVHIIIAQVSVAIFVLSAPIKRLKTNTDLSYSYFRASHADTYPVLECRDVEMNSKLLAVKKSENISRQRPSRRPGVDSGDFRIISSCSTKLHACRR
jgi:hypothetical protein